MTFEFGVKGYMEMLKAAKAAPEEKRARAAGDYLLCKAVDRMKEAGYSDSKIGRVVFEEALDYHYILGVGGLVKHVRETRRIPKRLTIPITRGHQTYTE